MKKNNTIIQETFDTVSGGYDHKALRFFSISADHFASIINLRGNEHVLDVAAGTGHTSIALSRYLPQGKITAVDFSEGMLARAKEKVSSLDIKNIEFKKMDMQALNFPDCQFDAAVCSFGIFFVDDMAAQLRHISQKVKDGGIVAICNFQENYLQPLRGLMLKRLESYNARIPLQPWKSIAVESGCIDLFRRAGINNVKVEQKNVGYFFENENEWWEVIWNGGFRRLISQLSHDDMNRFRKEHMEEVASLSTKNGIWVDIGVLYSIGIK